MVGLVLTPEQVNSAPPEVRAWLHSLLETEYGGPELRQAGRDGTGNLAAMETEEAVAVLDRIRGDFLACQVFFEFGREASHTAHLPPQLHRVAVPDVMRHTQIADIQHLAACFDTISAAFRDVRGDPEASLIGFDQNGGCYVHATTRRSIQAVWRQMSRPGEAATPDAGPSPFGPSPSGSSPVP
jgi:hypothetical protein